MQIVKSSDPKDGSPKKTPRVQKILTANKPKNRKAVVRKKKGT